MHVCMYVCTYVCMGVCTCTCVCVCVCVHVCTYVRMYVFAYHSELFYILQGYSSRRAFIAAQAPMEGTSTDVWEVIWQCGASTIVLLCQLEEDGKVCRSACCMEDNV